MTDVSFLFDELRRKSAGKRQPMQRLLYETLKQAILVGRLTPGCLLPASRVLSGDLRLARNTVLYAYEQLAAEGYVRADRRGTVVAELPAPARRSSLATAARRVTPEPRLHDGLADAVNTVALSRRCAGLSRTRTPHDDGLPFMPGLPALSRFPLPAWRRLLHRAWSETTPSELGYRWVAGEPGLRVAIARYVRAARGVLCDAGQVFITSGTQESVGLCAKLLADAGDVAWMEHPGYGGACTALRAAGLRVQPVAVDEHGLAPDESLWRRVAPKLIYTTPSHQYPLGVVLGLQRRLALIDGARRAGAWIIEDDYDSEFRHDGPPLAAMQGLAPDAPVVYLGTFSKTMFPALRIGFMVVPPAWADRVAAALGELVRRGHPAEQRALAAFIEQGQFTTHVRRMRKLYAERQAALRDALERQWPEVRVLGGSCGMHLTLPLPLHIDDVAIAQAAMQKGLSPRPLSAYGVAPAPPLRGLVLGYANTAAEDMAGCVRQLVRCWRSTGQTVLP